MPDSSGAVRLVWYVSYGSNLSTARMACYLSGGRPAGAARRYAGCRDRAPARATRPVHLPGSVYFAGTSAVWSGGSAFYDPDRAGPAAARAYLLTAGQFSDVVAQENRCAVGEDLDLETVLATGADTVGTGRYSRLLLVGHLDGHPMLTFTTPARRDDKHLNPPSPSYLAVIAAGLAEAHSWDEKTVAAYLRRLGTDGV